MAVAANYSDKKTDPNETKVTPFIARTPDSLDCYLQVCLYFEYFLIFFDIFHFWLVILCNLRNYEKITL